MRQIALDTETTGLEPEQGHRIIEIGGVEIINRRITHNRYHCYLQPDRKIDQEAGSVHGITDAFLKEQPRFADIIDDLLKFIQDAELLIHNAKFDVGFLNQELKLLKQNRPPLEHYCSITDTLTLARERHPGQPNNLDALCKRYNIDNSKRQLHGALLDAEILAEVYLAMTRKQDSLLALENQEATGPNNIRRIASQRPALKVILPTEEEWQAHQQYLALLNKASGGKCLWVTLE